MAFRRFFSCMVALAAVAMSAVACSSSSASSSGTTNGLRTTPPAHHRVAASTACPAGRASGQAPQPQAAGSTCSKDSECTTGKNGRCVATGPGIAGNIAFNCTYDECASDGECGAGKVCDCRADDTLATANVCRPAQCTVDADCGAGNWCSPSVPADGATIGKWYDGYTCHTPDDECYDDKECANPSAYTCALDVAKKHWTCSLGPAAG